MNITVKNPEIVRLMADIASFRAANGVTRSAFGVWAVNDPNLIRDLEAGRELRWATIEAIRSKMDAPAPKGIEASA